MADVRAAAPAIALGIAITGGSARVDRAPQLWRSCAGLTDAEMSRVATGGVVAKSLPSPEHRETAVAGAIRIGVPVEFFVRRFRDIVAFKRSEMVLQIGRFSDSPTAEDLRGLTFDPADLDALRRCRVGSCGLKLSAEAIERFRTGVDWNAANWRDQAATLARRMIAEAARAYMEHGDTTIRATNDKRKPIDPTAEFRALLANLGCDRNEAPRFFEYLVDYPQNRPADADSFIYWSKESFGMKSVISLTHVIIHRKAPDGPVLIATKGLLSSHYLDASLGLTLLFPTGTAAAPAVDVIYINRSRADALGGLFGGITRAIVSGRQRDGTVDELRALKGRLETSWRDGRPSGTLR